MRSDHLGEREGKAYAHEEPSLVPTNKIRLHAKVKD